MMQTLIRYQTKPEKTEENKRLIQDVFRELHAASPDGVRYVSFSDDDGNFFHFVTVQSEENPIPELAGVQALPGRNQRSLHLRPGIS